MKTKITKLFSIVTIITLLLLATGCSDMNTAPKAKNTGSGYTLTGSITVKGDTARTATSSFSFIKAKQYSVTAVYDDFTVNGTISNSDEGVTYTLNLPVKGTWTITATLTVNNKIYGTGQTTVAIPLNPPDTSFTTNDIQIQLDTDMDPTKQGAIKLPIYNNSSKNLTITWKWITTAKNGNSPLNDLTLNIAKDENGTFTVGSINCGSYEVELLFKDSADKLVYSCYETINVFSDFTTDLWYGESPYIDSSNKFVFTDEVAKTFAYVQQIPEGKPLYLLWSNGTEEIDTINFETPTQNQKGAQIFTEIEEGMVITNPINSLGTNYCFDGSTIYAPPYRYIKSYSGYVKDPDFNLLDIISSQYGYSDNITFLPNSNCVFLDGYLYFAYSMEASSIDWYMIGRYDTHNNTVIFSNNNIAMGGGTYNPSIEMDEYNEPPISFAVTHKDENAEQGVLYFSGNRQNIDQTPARVLYTLERQPFYIDDSDPDDTYIMFYNDGELSTDEIQPSLIYLDNLAQITAGLYKTALKITDMKIFGNYLYVLVWSYSTPLDEQTSEYYQESEPGVFEKLADNWQSNGGLLRFDITSAAAAKNAFIPKNWSSEKALETNGKVLGYYALPNYPEGDDPNSDLIDYYYDDQGNNSTPNGPGTAIDVSGNSQTVVNVLAVQPPLVAGAANPNYFYGPRKILAIDEENNKLLIADDGGFVRYDGLDDKFMPVMSTLPVNRIVTVDLTNEAISDVIDVGVTFSAQYDEMSHNFTIYYMN